MLIAEIFFVNVDRRSRARVSIIEFTGRPTDLGRFETMVLGPSG